MFFVAALKGNELHAFPQELPYCSACIVQHFADWILAGFQV